jgi:Rrf2 family protein
MIDMAAQYNHGNIKRKDIAHRQKISESYLENILITLKNSDLIDTTRGARGGYFLKKKPSEITLLDVVATLEGSLTPIKCLDDPEVCERSESCVMRSVWHKVQEAQENVLKKITLEDCVNDMRNSGEINYII